MPTDCPRPIEPIADADDLPGMARSRGPSVDDTRRRLLRHCALTLGAFPWLSACGGGGSDAGPEPTGTGNAPTPAPAPAPAPTPATSPVPAPPAPAAVPPPPAPELPPRPAAAAVSGPALVIDGDVWTPNVGSGGVIAVSDFDQLPMNRWLQVATNRLDDVIPNPRYPTFLGQPDGSRSIVNAWSGAAWDYVNQRMYISGGGHADSHFCENGVYMLDATTMRFSVAVARSAVDQAQYWNAQDQAMVSGMQGNGGGAPLKDGTIPASHTYDSLVWVPRNIANNRNGALLMFHDAVGVVDLDSGSYDTAYFDGPSPVDLSYKICEMDGWNVLHARASFYYRLWDMDPDRRSDTKWSADSRGAFVKQFGAGANVVYNHKMMVRMPQRREFVVLSGSANTRCRYGNGFDSGNREDWASFHDSITLTSTDGSDAFFKDPANWLDSSDDTPLFAAGGTYDHWGDCLWVQTNLAGGALFRISGLSSRTWRVERVASAAGLSSTTNGTYHRCQTVVRGTATLLLRVSSTTGLPEVCRVS